MKDWKVLASFATIIFALVSCVRSQPQVIIVTATAAFNDELPFSTSTPVILLDDTPPELQATPLPRAVIEQVNTQREYIVQAGDTLSAIAAANGVSVETLLAVNELTDPNILSIGQVLSLPEAPAEQSNNFWIIPDNRLVRAPGSATFDIAGFIGQQPGYIQIASDVVNERLLSSAEVVRRISLEYSVDARLLLALLEYRSGWLSRTDLSDTAKIYPMEGEPSPQGFDRRGLYRQLAWAANRLNQAYYGWKYGNLRILEFEDGTRISYNSNLNGATVGVQYFLSQNNDYLTWSSQILQEGFYQTYAAYFGDPFTQSIDPLVPNGLSQPELTLPFTKGETWFFTGGPHGGWGSGSAWSAIDFAPPDERTDASPLCYVSDYWATAVAPGIIARSEDGSVVLDLDMDGDESTGWSILYLHMATDDRISAGTIVQPGNRIGRPSCEGGFSNATHMHIARRYNGEWLPAHCDLCSADFQTPPFVMSGWTVYALTNQEYQGYMLQGMQQRTAEQGRIDPINHISW